MGRKVTDEGYWGPTQSSNFATLTDFSTSSSSNTPLTTLVEHLLQWATPQLGLVFIGRDSRRRAHTGWEVIDSELCTRRDSASAWHRAKVCARTMMLRRLSTSEESEESEVSEVSEESEVRVGRKGWEKKRPGRQMLQSSRYCFGKGLLATKFLYEKDADG